MVLFDTTARAPDTDNDNDNDNMVLDNNPVIDPNEPVTYLDQLNVAPNATAYSSVQNLSSQIAFVAPSNLFAWAYMTLGLHCCVPLQSPIPFPIYISLQIEARFGPWIVRNSMGACAAWVSSDPDPGHRQLPAGMGFVAARMSQSPPAIDISISHAQFNKGTGALGLFRHGFRDMSPICACFG